MGESNNTRVGNRLFSPAVGLEETLALAQTSMDTWQTTRLSLSLAVATHEEGRSLAQRVFRHMAALGAVEAPTAFAVVPVPAYS